MNTWTTATSALLAADFRERAQVAADMEAYYRQRALQAIDEGEEHIALGWQAQADLQASFRHGMSLAASLIYRRTGVRIVLPIAGDGDASRGKALHEAPVGA
jgi:hypothetical protein